MDTHLFRARLLTGIVLLSACGSDITGPTCSLAEGDLVISEIMADPAGDANLLEWFEIYNNTNSALPLSSVEITKKGTTSKTTKVVQLKSAGEIAPHSHYVLGASALPFVDYVYGTSFDLVNGGGILTIGCKGSPSDIVLYGDSGGAPAPSKGISLSFDGGVTPDALLNDSGAYWCMGQDDYDGTNMGTPGAANPSCGVATCTAPSGERDVVAPKVGELVVTEVLANPSGSDTGREWVEVYVAAPASVDFNSLEVSITNTRTGSSKTYKVASTTCLPAQPASYVVLGALDDPFENGGVQVDFVVPGLTISNTDPYSVTLSRGLVVIDSAVVPQVAEGSSARLDGARLGHNDNDEEGAFCVASAEQIDLFAGAGTPGVANGVCGLTSCQEGSEVRSVVRPQVGGLIVSEVLAEPSASTGGREWIELYVNSATPIDLNGLVLYSKNTGSTSQRSTSLVSADCMRVEPGTYVVLAGPEHALPSLLNADFTFSDLSLYNDVELLVEILDDGVLIDAAIVPPSALGASQSVMPENLSASGNDSPLAFCTSATAGVFEEKGTPGFANICGASCVGEGGLPRLARAPQAGDIKITEILANSRTDEANASDNGRDWVEFVVTGSTTIDLNGVKLLNTATNTQTWTLTANTCITVQPGDYAVIGGVNVGMQGIVPVATIGTSSATLFYASAASISFEMDDVPVASANYTSVDAKSHALDDNDDALWCTAASASNGFTGGMGSPGVANPSCD